MRRAPDRPAGVSGGSRLAGDRPDPEALALRIEALEARVARLEEGHPILSGESPPPLPPAVAEAMDEVSTSRPLALAGRTLIALGGGYLIRAATAAGALPAAVGAGFGLLYAAAWTLEADREARRGRGLPASLAAATGAALAFPLLWEGSTRFASIPPRAALAVAVAFALLAGAVGARRTRPSFAWLHLAPAIALALGLLVQVHDVLAVLATLALLHTAAEIAHDRLGWDGMRWATGAAAALVATGILVVVSPLVHVAAVAILAAVLLAAALARSQRRAPSVFDMAAGTSSLALAWIAVSALPPGARQWPAVVALAAAAAAYRAAAVAGSTGGANVLAAAATALAIAGTSALLPADARVIAWTGAGLLAAWRSARDRSLRVPAAAYIAVALTASGALASAAHGVAGIGDAGRLSLVGATAAIAAVAAALLAAKSEARAGRLAGGLLGGVGFAAVATSAWPTEALAGVVGTSTLAAAAAALVLATREDRVPVRHLAWTLLAAGGARLLLVDLRDGRPLTLFIGLVSYGGALLAAQASRGRTARSAP